MKNFTNFSFQLYTDILFGREAERQVGSMIKKYAGTKILFVYGSGSIKRNGLFDRVISSLQKEAISFVEFPGVQPNPRRSLVDRGLKIAMEEKVDFILAVGGGSTIDTAKAIGVALANDGEYWKFYNGVPAERMIPVGTIHTISAAGSETSTSSVLVDDVTPGGRKQGFGWPPCRPVFSIMNPELTYSVSPYQTAAGASDILAHTISRYFTNAASFLGDEYAEATMRTVVKYAPVVLVQPDDYEARAELMLAGSFSHNDITGIGRSGPKGGEHALVTQLSGYYDTAHGADLAMIMPAWLQYIVDHGTPDHVARIAQFGINVFGEKPDLADIKATANAGLKRFRAWIKSIGMPSTLKEHGIPTDDLQAVIQRCINSQKDGIIRGFMDLDKDAIAAIFSSVVE